MNSTKTANQKTAKLAAILAFAVTMAFAGSGFAQSDADSSASGAAGADEAAASEQDQEEGGEQEDEKSVEDQSWAELRGVQTVQKRYFQKVNRLAITAYGGIVPNSIFENAYPVGARINYFILENIGLELAGSYAFTKQTDLEGVLREPSGAATGNIRLADSPLGQVNFGILWSPFYGKTAFHQNSIGYFDLYLVGGAGLAFTRTRVEVNQPLETRITPEGLVGGGLAYYFLKRAAIRVDFRQFIFQHVQFDEGGGGGVAKPSEVSLGFGLFF